MALVDVYDYVVSNTQAMCLFRAGDAALPDPTAIYSSSGCAPLELDVSFIGDTADRSGNDHGVTLQGAVVDLDGIHFGGAGDFGTVDDFDYYSDETFTIAFWMTKEACTGTIYEYLYSHNQDDNSDITLSTNSNVNMYIGCAPW